MNKKTHSVKVRRLETEASEAQASGVHPTKVRPLKSHSEELVEAKVHYSMVHSVEEYDFSEGRKFFFDTNIWLYIYGPISFPDWRSDVYSRALKDIRASEGSIYINCMIISEFVNAFARIEFKQQSEFVKYKEFRNSPSFRPVAEDISHNVKKILKNTLICDPDLAAIKLPEIMDTFEEGRYDFNDLLFAEVCRAKDLIFVTHDRDFRSLEIEILTANERMLR
ncbi:type II toxin-antitoxin system VapC family toxin [Methanosarcina sp. Mfa9]|uniref:type II toxin-antitoxin system VapC family toxin n=1 Tax=Methanosarcina sp. Mfa9 TaxID=3439063 RepID=UPI003F84BB18